MTFLFATTTPEPAEAFLIAVPTPLKGDNHEPDLSYIEAASKTIVPVLQPGNLVIVESTSPVGATEGMLGRRRPGAELSVGCGRSIGYIELFTGVGAIRKGKVARPQIVKAARQG